jgi:hypothetical protein
VPKKPDVPRADVSRADILRVEAARLLTMNRLALLMIPEENLSMSPAAWRKALAQVPGGLVEVSGMLMTTREWARPAIDKAKARRADGPDWLRRISRETRQDIARTTKTATHDAA